MKESYREDLASSSGPELYADDGDVVGVATTGVHAGQPLSSDILTFARRSYPVREKATSPLPLWRGSGGRGGVIDPVHAWTSQAREPGDPVGFRQARVAWSLVRRNGQKTFQTVMLI